MSTAEYGNVTELGIQNLKALLELQRSEFRAEGEVTYATRVDRLQRLKALIVDCLLYTSPSPRDQRGSRMPSSA